MSPKRGDEASIIFHTIDDVLNFPDPEWLIKDMIVKGSFAVLFGPPKVGKSFLALSWAFAIAGDKPWLECPVMGAADTMIECSGAQEGYFTLQCEKQKDAEPFEKISLALLAVELDGGRSSRVPVSLLDAPAPPPPIWVKNAEQVLEILRTDFGSEGAVHGDWKRACIEKLGFSASTFDRAFRRVKERVGLIRVEGSGQGARYFANQPP